MEDGSGGNKHLSVQNKTSDALASLNYEPDNSLGGPYFRCKICGLVEPTTMEMALHHFKYHQIPPVVN
jgi:hypothetical protein